MAGRKMSTESKIKMVKSRGYTVHFTNENTLCEICSKDTGSYKRKTCSTKCYHKLLKLNSQINPKCGGQKHTHRSKIKNPKGEIFIAESTYEVRLAEILNSLNIDWIRPSYLWYHDNKNQKRRYYPDFYLNNLNLYLDPKNEYLIKTDIAKIINAATENTVDILIIGEKFLDLEKFKTLLDHDIVKNGCVVFN